MTGPADDERSAKARFYLKHRDVIEEWAALRADARAYLEPALLALEGPVAQMAAELGVEAYISPEDAIMTLYRSQWRSRSVDLSVGVGWDSRRLLSPGYTEWAWVGAYLDGAESARGRELAARLKALRQPHGFSAGNPWVLWRPVVAAAGQGIEPDEYAEQVVAEIRRSWDVISIAVDRGAG